MVLSEGNNFGVVFEGLPQTQLGDGLQGQTQQVGAQRDVLGLWERAPLSHQLFHYLD